MENYDEKIDTLINNALREKADEYEVSDKVKERIDQRIKGSEKKKKNGIKDRRAHRTE